MTITLEQFINELYDNGYGDLAFYLTISCESEDYHKKQSEFNYTLDISMIDNDMCQLYMDCGAYLPINKLIDIRSLNDCSFDYWSDNLQLLVLDLIQAKLYNRMTTRYKPEYTPIV